MDKEYKKIESVIDSLSPTQLLAVAELYENGIEIGRDLFLATAYYRMAAERGVPYAQYQMAMRTSEADGALLWLHMSAMQGLPIAMKELSDRIRDTDPKMSQKWLKQYYKSRDKEGEIEWFGEVCRGEDQPEVIDGEVVIKI